MKTYKYKPTTKDELKELVDKLISERGDNADLNDIDISEITDMCGLFRYSTFNGNTSERDVSKVTNTTAMFYNSAFNGYSLNWECFRC